MTDQIAKLAERFWRITPKEIQDMGITRQQFYEQEMRASLQPAMQAAVQYRRKDGGYGPRWITMAMFDGQLAAEAYCGQQRVNEWPFEYRVVELVTATGGDAVAGDVQAARALDREALVHTICPHIKQWSDGEDAPQTGCNKCPATVQTSQGEGVQMCRLNAQAAADDVIAMFDLTQSSKEQKC